jgi:hypothetical protein
VREKVGFGDEMHKALNWESCCVISSLMNAEDAVGERVARGRERRIDESR